MTNSFQIQLSLLFHDVSKWLYGSDCHRGLRERRILEQNKGDKSPWSVRLLARRGTVHNRIIAEQNIRSGKTGKRRMYPGLRNFHPGLKLAQTQHDGLLTLNFHASTTSYDEDWIYNGQEPQRSCDTKYMISNADNWIINTYYVLDTYTYTDYDNRNYTSSTIRRDRGCSVPAASVWSRREGSCGWAVWWSWACLLQ